MNCPKCPSRPLAPRTVGVMQLDHCPECGGVWCDAAELPQLLSLDKSIASSVSSGRFSAPADARAGVCPRDGTRLLRVASAHRREVIIESCPACRGIWLDGGELGRLLAD